MGGANSGRDGGWGRDKVESRLCLDANAVMRAGYRRQDYTGSWTWQSGGRVSGWIDIRAVERGLLLEFRYRAEGAKWQNVHQLIFVTERPCPFGGSRCYFRCGGPHVGEGCGEKVQKLYAGNLFLCRKCSQLSYASQSEDAAYRAHRRLNKALKRLSGDFRPGGSLPERPKGMWHRTYERLYGECVLARLQEINAFVKTAR